VLGRIWVWLFIFSGKCCGYFGDYSKLIYLR
jgi:hypothetical protein